MENDPMQRVSSLESSINLVDELIDESVEVQKAAELAARAQKAAE
jgi:hypothetical protein